VRLRYGAIGQGTRIVPRTAVPAPAPSPVEVAELRRQLAESRRALDAERALSRALTAQIQALTRVLTATSVCADELVVATGAESFLPPLTEREATPASQVATPPSAPKQRTPTSLRRPVAVPRLPLSPQVPTALAVAAGTPPARGVPSVGPGATPPSQLPVRRTAPASVPGRSRSPSVSGEPVASPRRGLSLSGIAGQAASTPRSVRVVEEAPRHATKATPPTQRPRTTGSAGPGVGAAAGPVPSPRGQRTSPAAATPPAAPAPAAPVKPFIPPLRLPAKPDEKPLTPRKEGGKPVVSPRALRRPADTASATAAAAAAAAAPVSGRARSNSGGVGGSGSAAAARHLMPPPPPLSEEPMPSPRVTSLGAPSPAGEALHSPRAMRVPLGDAVTRIVTGPAVDATVSIGGGGGGAFQSPRAPPAASPHKLETPLVPRLLEKGV
jgi:hypothetical protein